MRQMTFLRSSIFFLSNRLLLSLRNIGEGVSGAENLKVLRIHQSAIDDNKVIYLLSNMSENKSLTKLEFSNCLIGDNGAIAVAKYLRDRSNIEELNLCNNKIGESGMEALSYVLTQENSSPIKSLNLRFNAFGNAGLRFLASALIREHPKVEILNLSCCNLDEEAGILLAEMMKRNVLIRELNLSSNRFGDKVGRAIEAGMDANKTITFLDLRMTGIPKKNMVGISKSLHFNRIRARKGEKGVLREMQLMEMRLQEGRGEEKDESNEKVQTVIEPEESQALTETEEQANDWASATSEENRITQSGRKLFYSRVSIHKTYIFSRSPDLIPAF